MLHRVDELGVHQINRVQATFLISVEQYLDWSDQLVQMRRIAQLHGMRNDLGADPVQKTQTLVADRYCLNLIALSFQLTQFRGQQTQGVGVHAAAQTFVGRYNDETNVLGVVLLHHERVRVLWIGLRQVRSDITNLVTVGTCRTHPVLRLAHFGCGDHFHRLGDLLRIFYALDLAAYLFTCSHSVLQLN